MWITFLTFFFERTAADHPYDKETRVAQHPSGKSEIRDMRLENKKVFKKSVKVSAIRFYFFESTDILIDMIFVRLRKYQKSIRKVS